MNRRRVPLSRNRLEAEAVLAILEWISGSNYLGTPCYSAGPTIARAEVRERSDAQEDGPVPVQIARLVNGRKVDVGVE